MKFLHGETMKNSVLKKGVYRHYKNYYYEVINVATHTETMEEFVVYRALYGEELVWIRPLSMFVETVVINEKNVPRFSYVGENIDVVANQNSDTL